MTNNRIHTICKTAASLIAPFLWIGCLIAQDATPERVTVPLSDPARPAIIRANLMNGSITVKGGTGKEVIVEAHSESGEGRRRESRTPRNAEGMKRLDTGAMGLTIEEFENTVRIGTGANGPTTNLVIQVPSNSSLKVKTMNGGEINVDRVNGDVEATAMNGGATLTNVSGSVVVNAMNGPIKVTLNRITPDKPMSFVSMNGDVDVTLPADAKARIKMRTENGEIFSDFDVRMESSAKPVIEDGRGKGGKYRVQIEKGMYGTINGGGPEFEFKTFNGNIFIRKPK